MVYCIHKFNGAVERDHKIIKTRKMKNFSKDAFYLMFLISAGSILPVKLMT